MKSEYWSSVGKKLLSLGKTALNLVAPVAINYGITKAVEKACSIIEGKIKELYKQTAINSAISLTINLSGILILIFKPFGENDSRYMACVFFFASFIFWLVRTIVFVKNYGKVTVQISKSIIKQKSVCIGIEQYVLTEFPLIALGYAGIAVTVKYVPKLKEIPRISEFVKYLVKVFRESIALLAGIMGVYTITVFGILKPLLIHRYF